MTSPDLTAHLRPDAMGRAQRALLAKAVGEFSHERLLAPEVTGDGTYRLVAPDGTTYDFAARRYALEHWEVDPDTLVVTLDGLPVEPDAQWFVAQFADDLGIPASLLPVYLEEVAATLASSAWKLASPRPSSADLLGASHQEIEAAMTEGHPAFVANNGRIGFGVDDFAAYAPEAGQPVRLVWLAVRRSQARLSLAAGLDEATHWEREVGAEALARWREVLHGRGEDPDAFTYLPVHPWQWVNKIAVTFAPDVARGDLVHLGEHEEPMQAQQSIRTFFPLEHPERSFVKTALAIQNMGFLRGLSPAYMGPTPAINDWVAGLVAGDATLQDCGLTVLREHAAIGWTGDVFHRLPDSSPYRKMLAALWRESPVPGLAPGERLATMASLLHRDADGVSYLSQLVAASGLEPAVWVRAYLRAYVRPLVHLLLAHDTVLMPHGENVILVLEGHVPVRAVMKDIGEEVCVLSDRPLPAEVERIRADVPVDEQSLSIHTDVFDGVLRYVAAIAHRDGLLDEGEFWALVRECIVEHAEDHPELADAVARHDLLRARFRHSCLNRLQLRNTLQMVDLTDQAQSLIHAGTLANPVAAPDVVAAAAPVAADLVGVGR